MDGSEVLDPLRFFCHVAASNGCWDWRGCRDECGYGVMAKKVGGRRIYFKAHRVSWAMHRGAIPSGLCVLHRCDRPCCVNPGHLYVGTDADNNRDKVERKRHAHGVRHGMSKLTEAQVLEIRATGRRRTIVETAKLYGISHPMVSYILNRKAWRHLPEESPQGHDPSARSNLGRTNAAAPPNGVSHDDGRQGQGPGTPTGQGAADLL